MMTNATALPSPDAVLYSEETEINEHIPKKFASTMLLVKSDARKITKGLIAGVLTMLSTSNSYFTSNNIIHNPNHYPDQEKCCWGHHHDRPGL